MTDHDQESRLVELMEHVKKLQDALTECVTLLLEAGPDAELERHLRGLEIGVGIGLKAWSKKL